MGEIRTDEALQEVWKIEPHHVAFARDDTGAFKKLGQGELAVFASIQYDLY